GSGGGARRPEARVPPRPPPYGRLASVESDAERFDQCLKCRRLAASARLVQGVAVGRRARVVEGSQEFATGEVCKLLLELVRPIGLEPIAASSATTACPTEASPRRRARAPAAPRSARFPIPLHGAERLGV